MSKMRAMTKTVCLFLKSPRLGEAKTRLARGIGAVRASAIYRALVEHQAAEIPVGWKVTVYFAPSSAGEEMKLWLAPELPDGTRFLPQCDGDLGQRLWTAVRKEFDSGSQRVYLIGGDCPALSRDYFAEADRALSDHDIVLGPATDGGYVLFGIRGPHEVLFRNIAWSTPAVLDQTLAAAREQTLSVRLLRPLVDIDDAATLDDQSKIFPFLRESCKRS
jgi:rSAM/selenodomain-associated transferase 1